MSEILKTVKQHPKVFKLVYKNMSEADIISFLNVHPFLIEDIENPTIDMMFAAIQEDTDSILYIENPPKAMIRHAIVCNPKIIRRFKNYKIDIPKDLHSFIISENPLLLEYIVDPEESIIVEAVTADFRAIKNIPNPSLEVQLSAIKNSNKGRAIELIKNLHEDAAMAAIEIDPDNIRYVKKEYQTEKIIEFYIDRCTSSNDLSFDFYQIHTITENILWKALKKDVCVAESVDISKITYDMAKYILSKDGSMISMFKKPTKELKWIAIKKTPSSIRYIKNVTLDMIKYVLDTEGHEPYVVKHLNRLSQRTIFSLLKTYPYLVSYLTDVTYSNRLYKLAEDSIILACAWYDKFTTQQKVYLKLKFGLA